MPIAAISTTMPMRIQSFLPDTADSPPKTPPLLAENDAAVQWLKRFSDQRLVGRAYFANAASNRSKKASKPAWAWPLMTKVGVALTLYLATPSSPTLLIASSSLVEARHALAASALMPEAAASCSSAACTPSGEGTPYS